MRRIVAPILTAVIALAPLGVLADDPPPFPEFTFKRVTPPKPGAKRILVQIDPTERVAAAPKSKPEPEKTAPTLAYDWYWQTMSPGTDGAGPARIEAALNALNDGPGVPAPRLQSLQSIATTYGADILTATIGTQVSPALVLAVIAAESSGRSTAVSPKGATGLMQLMPDTASRFGVIDRTDATQNIRGGVAYLDWLMTEFSGDPILVLAGYNAGEGAVKTHGGVPPFDETRAYVPKVLAAFSVARGLCMTPPQLVSDGCAFRLAGASDG